MSLPETIPVRREPEAVPSSPSSELAWMGAVVLLIFIVAMVWSKLRGTSANPNLAAKGGHWLSRLQMRTAQAPQVRGSTRLTPTHSLHEVEWQGRRLLVGCSSHSIQVLSETAIGAESDTEPSAEAGRGTDAGHARKGGV
jgi:flagellar biogenesis protein FliO